MTLYTQSDLEWRDEKIKRLKAENSAYAKEIERLKALCQHAATLIEIFAVDPSSKTTEFLIELRKAAK